MTLAIKQVSVQKGHDPARFALACFGGAGGQHACLVADELGMDTVFLHPYAGVLSAYGMGLADQGALREQAVEVPFGPGALAGAGAGCGPARGGRASGAGRARRRAPGASRSAASSICATPAPRPRCPWTSARRIRSSPSSRRRTARASASPRPSAPWSPRRSRWRRRRRARRSLEPELPPREGGGPEPLDQVPLWTGGQEREAPVFDRASLCAGDRIAGPALVRESVATIVVEPGWTAEVTERNHILLRRTEPRARAAAPGTERADPVLLELFNNLFMHVAEQTGVVLRNTSLSVNIKERLDFSCAIFDADGNLVANAPHVPVHLGAMGESVKHVLRLRGNSLRPGDVVALNNPYGGGTHLPDVTVITPVFDDAGREIRFFVGSRGHHADIGGLTPGSTPPGSRTLEEEGVVIDDFLLVDAGRFREHEFRALLA